MDQDVLLILFVTLGWWGPLVVLALTLVGGAALGAVIVAAVGAIRSGFPSERRGEPDTEADLAAFFENAR